MSESLSNIKELFDFEITTCDPNETNDKNIKKLDMPSSAKSRINQLFSQLPSLVTAETLNTQDNLYRVVFPEGVSGTLLKLKNGGYGTPLVNEVHDFVGSASMYKVDIHTVLLPAFSAMSIATGQYFLADINTKLEKVNQKIDKILDFLYGDKKAELMAEVSFVQYAYKNYRSIMSCDQQRIATIASIQEARKVAMKDIEFYMSDLYLKSTSTVKSYEDFETISEECFQIKDSLELAVQLYVMSNLMEVFFSQNNDSDYLKTIKEDMNYYVTKCENRILSVFSKLNGKTGEFKGNLFKKIDPEALIKKYETIIDSLSSGEDSKIKKTINSALKEPPKEYYLKKNGDVFIKTA